MYKRDVDSNLMIVWVIRLKICVSILLSAMISTLRGIAPIPSQLARSCIIFHPLAFVFHAQPVFGLVITGSLFKIQTSTHNQLP